MGLSRSERKRRAMNQVKQDPEKARLTVERIVSELEVPEDLVEKMVYEGWTVQELALEHAARMACEDYKPFSLSPDTLRKHHYGGKKALKNDRD